MRNMVRVLPIAAFLTMASACFAAPVVWVDWTSGTPGSPGSATGTLTIGVTTVTVNFTGELAFIQTSGGTNFWNPAAPYISTLVDNEPPASDILSLNAAGQRTLTFSQPVDNLFFALVSLNGNAYLFDRDFEVVSYGCGYFGCGDLVRTDLGGGVYRLNGSGEPHGVIRFVGSVSSITWTSTTDEYWHGFTVGTYGLGTAIPEPSAVLLLGIGLAGLSVLRRLEQQYRRARTDLP